MKSRMPVCLIAWTIFLVLAVAFPPPGPASAADPSARIQTVGTLRTAIRLAEKALADLQQPDGPQRLPQTRETMRQLLTQIKMSIAQLEYAKRHTKYEDPLLDLQLRNTRRAKPLVIHAIDRSVALPLHQYVPEAGQDLQRAVAILRGVLAGLE